MRILKEHFESSINTATLTQAVAAIEIIKFKMILQIHVQCIMHYNCKIRYFSIFYIFEFIFLKLFTWENVVYATPPPPLAKLISGRFLHIVVLKG